MPGLILDKSRDPQTRKTAGGATAAPVGAQPILVQTECALADDVEPTQSSGSVDFRWDELFPKSSRRAVVVRAAVLSPPATRTGSLPRRPAAGSRLAPAAHPPETTAPIGNAGEDNRWTTEWTPSAASDRTRRRTVRLCRRKVFNEEGNARQRAPTGGKPDCHRREWRPGRAVYRAQQSRKLCRKHL